MAMPVMTLLKKYKLQTVIKQRDLKMTDNVKNERGMTNCVLQIDESMYFSTTATAIVNNQKEGVNIGTLTASSPDFVYVSIDGLEERVNFEPLNKAVFSKEGKVTYSEGKGGRYWFSDSDPITLPMLADLIAYSLILEGKESKTIMVPIQDSVDLEFKELQIRKCETSKVIEIPKLSFEEATYIYEERNNGYCIMEGLYPKLEIVEDKITVTLHSELCIDELLAIYWLARYGIEKRANKVKVLIDVEDFIGALESAGIIYSDENEFRIGFNGDTVVSRKVRDAFANLVDKTRVKD